MVRTGIPGVHNEPGLRALLLGSLVIHFGAGPTGLLPICTHNTLWSAAPITTKGKIVKLVGGHQRGTALLCVDGRNLAFPEPPPELDFSGDPLMPRLMWPGGEGVEVPTAQSGMRSDPDQVQLFALTEGKSILVVDKNVRIMNVTMHPDGIPHAVMATVEDVVRHVIGRSLFARTGLELLWCLRVLNRIGKRDLAEPVLTKMQHRNPRFVLDWDNLRLYPDSVRP